MNVTIRYKQTCMYANDGTYANKQKEKKTE